MSCRCGITSARVLLVLFNTVLVLCGLALLGIGLWVKVDPKVGKVQDLAELQSDTRYIYISSYVLIGVGGFVVIVGVFGCCGGLTSNRCLLGLYIFLLIIVFLGHIAAAIMAIVFKVEVLGNIKRDLLLNLREEYRPGRAQYTRPWDFVQAWLDCCGVNGFKDYRNVFPLNSTCPTNVPNSCCTLKSSDPDDIIPVDEKKCQLEAKTDVGGPNVKTKGCIDAIMDKITQYNGILIGIAVGLAVIEILGVILACCLCRTVPRKGRFTS
ncbi:tetraspanin-18-like [Gigantopelta aegis]|uniref:tetraspanin-18-like n=1 Tax=Gigantopelta aegis TaxID=1735272 RepID=UPI001B88B444|nr:tetraspanin-18-like [Gigantopelta aegis]